MLQRHIDGRLSTKAQNLWPDALIVREVDARGAETWWLERGRERVALGGNLPAVHRSLDALRKAEAARASRGEVARELAREEEGVTPDTATPGAGARRLTPGAEARAFAEEAAGLLDRARALRAHLLATVVDDEAMSEAHTQGTRPLTPEETIVDVLEELLESDLEWAVERLRSLKA